MKLKLVGAERYCGPGTDGEIIEKGTVVEMSEAHALASLELNYMDALNNVLPLFVEHVEPKKTSVKAVDPEDDDVLDEAPKKIGRKAKVE